MERENKCEKVQERRLSLTFSRSSLPLCTLPAARGKKTHPYRTSGIVVGGRPLSPAGPSKRWQSGWLSRRRRGRSAGWPFLPLPRPLRGSRDQSARIVPRLARKPTLPCCRWIDRRCVGAASAVAARRRRETPPLPHRRRSCPLPEAARSLPCSRSPRSRASRSSWTR